MLGIVRSAMALLGLLFFGLPAWAQRTQIRGFVDVRSSYQDKKVSFGLGEQDLFITSELNDRLSFLGESVFKFTPTSSTMFNVSIERIILKYNYAGNHNLLAGKHHTPVNYWNDTYHHGRVFFPTIERPLLFEAGIIPLHTTGVSLQGQNLGDLKFGYDLMVGNGIGSNDIVDNNKYKSVTAAMHLKPVDGLRLGASYYHDVITKGSMPHDYMHSVNWTVTQNLLTASVAYFGKKYEVLTESTFAMNNTDTTGMQRSMASYLYAGWRATEKIVPYVRVDNIHYGRGEVYFEDRNLTSFVGGVRYEINYLSVLKLEYQHTKTSAEVHMGMMMPVASDKLTLQLAIGF